MILVQSGQKIRVRQLAAGDRGDGGAPKSWFHAHTAHEIPKNLHGEGRRWRSSPFAFCPSLLSQAYACADFGGNRAANSGGRIFWIKRGSSRNRRGRNWWRPRDSGRTAGRRAGVPGSVEETVHAPGSCWQLVRALIVLDQAANTSSSKSADGAEALPRPLALSSTSPASSSAFTS